MVLVAHYDLELNHMNVKTTFLNGELDGNVYMTQPKGFAIKDKQKLGCHIRIKINIKILDLLHVI